MALRDRSGSRARSAAPGTVSCLLLGSRRGRGGRFLMGSRGISWEMVEGRRKRKDGGVGLNVPIQTKLMGALTADKSSRVTKVACATAPALINGPLFTVGSSSSLPPFPPTISDSASSAANISTYFPAFWFFPYLPTYLPSFLPQEPAPPRPTHPGLPQTLRKKYT